MRGAALLAPIALISVTTARPTAGQRPAPACDQLEAASRAAPENAEIAAAFGRCAFRDYEMIALGGDSARLAFRSSWTSALRALRRAIAANPTYAGVYRPLFRILFAETRDGCSSITWKCEYVSPVVRDGDTIVTIPRRAVLNVSSDTYDEVVQQSQDSRRRNLTEAREIAMRWVAAAHQEPASHAYLGQALLRLGDTEAAHTELELAASLGTAESRRALFWDRVEALIRTNRGADARRVIDETAGDPHRDTNQVHSYDLANLNALVGRYRPAPVDSVLARRFRARLEAIVRSRPSPGIRSPTFAELVAKGDTSAARQLLERQDAANAPHPAPRRFIRMNESALWSAEQHLALGDTAIAIGRLAEIERLFNEPQFRYSIARLAGGQTWLGRVWLLTGDVSAAQGRMDDARSMYARVLGLWGGDGVDADVKPIVDKATLKLASLPR